MKFLLDYFIISLIVLIVTILSSLLNFKICLINNLFHFPCPGCGMTRSFILLLKGHFIEALKYNFILPIVLVIYVAIIVWNIEDYKSKKHTFEDFTKKYKAIIITIAVILTLIQWIANLNNPLLY